MANFLVLLFLSLLPLACRSTVSRGMAEVPVPSSRTLYAKPHFGLTFYGPDNRSERAVAGRANAYFDPKKPTLVFFQGWSKGELEKDKGRTFRMSEVYDKAPDIDLVKAWNDKGWNFAFMDWGQFSDTNYDRNFIGAIPAAFTYDNAERKIWSTDEQGNLVYHLSDGTAVNYPAASVADVLAKSYFDFMSQAQPGPSEIRFYGHSIGAQLAIAVAHKVREKAGQDYANVVPVRISLTDMMASNCPHAWLPSQQTRQRSPTPGCAASTAGDWVGERLHDLVVELKNQNPPVAFDAYSCWPLSSSGLGGDQLTQVLDLMAFTEMKPNTSATDLNQKHAFCLWNYLASVTVPPPALLPVPDSASPCAKIREGLSASTGTEALRNLMALPLRWTQTSASIGPSPGPYTMSCQSR